MSAKFIVSGSKDIRVVVLCINMRNAALWAVKDTAQRAALRYSFLLIR